VLQGERLAELARHYVQANNVIDRLANWMDVEALRALSDGLTLNLDDAAQAEASALALKAALHDADVEAVFDERTDKHLLRISRRHHGNIKSSIIGPDFLHGDDYDALALVGREFKGLLGDEAVAKRGEGEKAKEMRVADFRAAMAWLMQQAEAAWPPALQGPGRNEPRAALGNHHGPRGAPPAARADRRRHRGRQGLHHADGRRGGAAARLHRDECAEGGEHRRVSLWIPVARQSNCVLRHSSAFAVPQLARFA
jgi:hypothetical protein